MKFGIFLTPVLDLAPDTLEHYVIPGLEALLVDCQDVFPDKLSMVDNMLREVRAKTVL